VNPVATGTSIAAMPQVRPQRRFTKMKSEAQKTPKPISAGKRTTICDPPGRVEHARVTR
jgi:hypothetical protein